MIKLHRAMDGWWYFTIEKQEVITTSETYTSKQNAHKGMFAQADAVFDACGYVLPRVSVIEYRDMTKGGKLMGAERK